jgi:hypothetical protein
MLGGQCISSFPLSHIHLQFLLIPLSLPKQPVNNILICFSMDLLILDILYKWIHTILNIFVTGTF